MNQKVLAGFLAGAVAASVITYFVSHDRSTEAPPTVAAPVAATVAPGPATSVPPVEVITPPARKSAPKKIARVEALAPVPVESSAAPAPTEPEVTPPAPAPPAVEVVQSAPEPTPPQPPPALAPVVPAEPPHSVTIANGTLLSVRLGEALSTKRNQSGDAFPATLDKPLIVDGFVIAERGAHVDGRIIQAEQAGRMKGLARLTIELTRITTSDGQNVDIHTAQFDKNGPESKGEDAAKIGIGAVLGTIIGAAAGGGKGAAIGAAGGGAAGTGTVMATRGKPAELPVETLLTFKIDRPATITERKRM